MPAKWSRDQEQLEFIAMRQLTATRKIATYMIATAIMMQSFVVADHSSCNCSAPGCATSQNACSVAGHSVCRCSEKSKREGTCCCARQAEAVEVAVDCCSGESCCSAEANSTTSACCGGDSENPLCQCGCSDQHPKPLVPADTPTSRNVNWEVFFEGLSCVDTLTLPQLNPGTICSGHANQQQPQSCTVQTLYCTWRT